MKRFDAKYFNQWVNHCGFDFDSRKRTDHERSENSRMQFRCVFQWARRKPKTMEVAGKEVQLGSQKTPKTFIEIDEEGYARVKAGSKEEVINITEMVFKGSTLLIKTAEGNKKKLDGKKLATL